MKSTESAHWRSYHVIRSVIALAPTSLLMKRRASSGTSTPDGSSSVFAFSDVLQVADPFRRLPVHGFLGRQDDPVNEIQLLVADQARPGEVAGADDGGEGPQPIRPVVRPHLVLVEEVRLGVEEAVVVEPDFHLVGPKEGDQFLDQLQRGLGERLGFQVALQPLLQRLGVGSEADIGPGVRLGSQDETERPDLVQPLLHQPVAGDGEVRRGDVERLADALGQQFVQRIRQAVLLVVDDEGNAHAVPFRFPHRLASQSPVCTSS